MFHQLFSMLILQLILRLGFGNNLLGLSLVKNSNFTFPNIYPIPFQDFPKQIEGWKTNRKYIEIFNPLMVRSLLPFTCSSFLTYSEKDQFLDTDSIFCNEYYHQSFNISQNRTFLLSLNYVSTLFNNPDSTKFRILWNGKIIDQKRQSSCQLRYAQYQVVSIMGTNELAFEGSGIADSYGILIRNIQLRQIYQPTSNGTNTNESFSINSTQNNSDSQMSSTTQSYSVTQAQKNETIRKGINSTYELLLSMNLTSQQLAICKDILLGLNFADISPIAAFYKFPGLKKAIKEFIGYLIQFNRLLLFNYHNRNFTVTASLILSSIQYMDDLKGVLSDKYIYPHLGISTQILYQSFKASNEFINTHSSFFSINTLLNTREGCLAISITDFFVWELPTALLMFAIGWLCFHLLFKYRISILFRSFSMIGLLYLSLIQGKLEVISFQFASQLLFFSFNTLSRKVVLVLITYFFFILFFLGCSSWLLFTFLYGKISKYLFDSCKVSLVSAFLWTFYYGILSILLGFSHRLLRNYPGEQLATIIGLELCSVGIQVYCLSSRISQNLTSSYLFLMISVGRILFYFTMAVPLQYQQIFNIQINYCQYYIVLHLVLFVFVSALLSIIQNIKKTILLIRRSICLNNLSRQRGERSKQAKKTIIKLKKLNMVVLIKNSQQIDYQQKKKTLSLPQRQKFSAEKKNEKSKVPKVKIGILKYRQKAILHK